MYALFLLLLGAVILTLKVALERVAEFLGRRIFALHNYNIEREFELDNMYTMGKDVDGNTIPYKYGLWGRRFLAKAQLEKEGWEWYPSYRWVHHNNPNDPTYPL